MNVQHARADGGDTREVVVPLKKFVPVPDLVMPPVPLMLPAIEELKLPLKVSRFVVSTLVVFPVKVRLPETAFQVWLVHSVIALLMVWPLALLLVTPPARMFNALPPSTNAPALLLKTSELMSQAVSTLGRQLARPGQHNRRRAVIGRRYAPDPICAVAPIGIRATAIPDKDRRRSEVDRQNTDSQHAQHPQNVKSGYYRNFQGLNTTRLLFASTRCAIIISVKVNSPMRHISCIYIAKQAPTSAEPSL